MADCLNVCVFLAGSSNATVTVQALCVDPESGVTAVTALVGTTPGLGDIATLPLAVAAGSPQAALLQPTITFSAQHGRTYYVAFQAANSIGLSAIAGYTQGTVDAIPSTIIIVENVCSSLSVGPHCCIVMLLLP